MIDKHPKAAGDKTSLPGGLPGRVNFAQHSRRFLLSYRMARSAAGLTALTDIFLLKGNFFPICTDKLFSRHHRPIHATDNPFVLSNLRCERAFGLSSAKTMDRASSQVVGTHSVTVCTGDKGSSFSFLGSQAM